MQSTTLRCPPSRIPVQPPPIRIRRESPRATRPPAPPPPAKAAKPKGPATTPRKPIPRVDNPSRIRECRENRKVPSKSVMTAYYSSPFRVRLKGGQWHCVWIGSEMFLADDRRPAGWRDIACQTRHQAALLALSAYEHWITAPRQAGRLARLKARLKGFNLRCRCPVDYPCHADVLIRLVNAD